MTTGIYAYWDNENNYYTYVGKDSNIDMKIRHKAHIRESNWFRMGGDIIWVY